MVVENNTNRGEHGYTVDPKQRCKDIEAEIKTFDLPPTDEKILKDIHDKLMKVANFDATLVEVIVDDGVVTLNGKAEESVTKGIIEYTIQDIEGIKEIRNNLHVGLF